MKSLAMNKLFSKSNESDLPKISSNIDFLLAEQRHQRNDLKVITKKLDQVINEFTVQKQVTDYYNSEDSATEPEEVETL